MYSQTNVRVGKSAAPYPSVAVRDRGHLKGVAGSRWVRGAGRGKTARGWKGDRPGVRLETEQKLARSPKITSGMQRFMTERSNPLSTDLWVKHQTNGIHEFILLFSILLQIDRLQLTAVYCNRREV